MKILRNSYSGFTILVSFLERRISFPVCWVSFLATGKSHFSSSSILIRRDSSLETSCCLFRGRTWVDARNEDSFLYLFLFCFVLFLQNGMTRIFWFPNQNVCLPPPPPPPFPPLTGEFRCPTFSKNRLNHFRFQIPSDHSRNARVVQKAAAGPIPSRGHIRLRRCRSKWWLCLHCSSIWKRKTSC